jgi:glycosyltransferase involved in cell wall biosynthesis
MENIKLAIVIATYKRADGKTPEYLHKALECVTKQTYKNYKVFLIGDDYDSYGEIDDVLKSLNNPQIEFENLPSKSEREKYSGMDLWVCGGLNTINYAIEKALSEGYEINLKN